MTDKAKELLAPHKDAVMFWKVFGNWPGGDIREIAKVARELGMPEHEINFGCSGCIESMLRLISEHLDPNDINEFKQRKGL